MSLTTLSKKSGITVSALSKFLNGNTKTIKSTTLTGLINAMNLNKSNIGELFILDNNFPSGNAKGDNNENPQTTKK